jgi:hypothetical protein
MELWSEWYSHDGMNCPVPLGTWVEVIIECVDNPTKTIEGRVSGSPIWYWSNFNKHVMWQGKQYWCDKRVVRYRTKQYQAGIDLMNEVRLTVPPLKELVE